ncbi:MAG: hypothetical protein ABJG78_06455 [Cyclobacteriaceae bacterium]
MKNSISILSLFFCFLVFSSCSEDDSVTETEAVGSISDYSGTGSVTQGLATTTTTNLFDCGGRVAGVGTINDTEGNSWVVPAENNYANSSFPFASDLNNTCSGNNYENTAQAVAALQTSNIVEIDSDGEVITAFVFADNYFEMYVNGIAVGKDNVPFTQFNSDIVQFKVNRPFSVVMKLIDWEENLGLGTEDNQGSAYHPGDGGMVAAFRDESDETIAVTDASWKAQTFYTAPVKDLTCLSENGTQRLSSNCDTSGSDNGSNYYGIHWEVPGDWTNETFDDSSWPDATTYTNATIGVDNKSSYTNFTDIFDDSSNDAQFIWSTNVILDNEVIVRKTID